MSCPDNELACSLEAANAGGMSDMGFVLNEMEG